MKKTFALFSIGWLTALGLFNVVTFVTPNEVDGVSKFDASFWVAYSLITAFFIGQLICSYFVIRTNSMQKAFYNLSLFKTGITTLVFLLIVGSISIAIIPIPDWIGIVLCCAVLAFYIIAVIKTLLAVGMVEAVDKKVKVKTMFLKMLTADAETLIAKAEGEEMNAIAKKVYDAIRYSDPMSDDALAIVEGKISDTFATLNEAVEAGNVDAAETASKQILILLTERNAKCKILK